MPSFRSLRIVCIASLLHGGLSLGPAMSHAAPNDEASRHFDAGVQAFEERRFADAATEFEHAHDLNPAWQLLYNLGSVYAALGRPVESVASFTRYLELGDGNVAQERRREVEDEITRQRAKIALVDVVVSAPGADVRVDSQRVGRSPMTLPLELSAGTHVIDVELDGYRPERREVALAGQQRVRLEFALMALAAGDVYSAAAAPVVVAPPPATPPEQAQASTVPPAPSGSSGTGQRIAAYVVGGAGLAGVGVGIAIFASGQSKHLDAVDTANAGDRDLAEQMESEANRQKTQGLATLGIGGALVLGGVVLLVTAPSGDGAPSRSAARLSPWASATSGGLWYGGAW